jgi:Zn-dependent peptidase ImmA (M78 family)
MGSPSTALPSHLSKDTIRNIAESLREVIDCTEDFDIAKAVERLGGTITVRDFWDDSEKTGSLVVRGTGDFEIFIPKHTTPERDRFTIAHELGHYMIHYICMTDRGVGLPLTADRYGSGRVEWEANWFAGAFLMPHAQFERAICEQANDLSKVAKKFQVSEQAARIRAKDLQIEL